jgi:hypothetical protein
MPTRDEFIAQARTHIGTPFKHQGRLPGIALDCVGHLVLALSAIGVPVVDTKNYRRHADWPVFMAKLRDHGEFIGASREAVRPGCILALKDGKYQTHCAIAAFKNGEMTIIHAYEPYGKTVEERLTSAHNVKAVFWPNGVTDG